MNATTSRPTTPAVTDRNWRDYATCRSVDPELFYVVATGPAGKSQREVAKGVCRACPVRETCLRWALDTGQTAGIWGGLDERELRDAARRRSELPAEKAGNVLDLAEKPKPKPKPPGPSILQQVLGRRHELERLLADGETHRTAAELIGVPGATKGTITKAVVRIRAERVGAGVAA